MTDYVFRCKVSELLEWERQATYMDGQSLKNAKSGAKRCREEIGAELKRYFGSKEAKKAWKRERVDL